MPRDEVPGFAARLVELRTAAGLSQAELGDRAGTSHSAVSHLERGVRQPSFALALRLADALGVEVTAFVPKRAKRKGTA